MDFKFYIRVIAGNKQEDYYLDEYDRVGKEKSNPIKRESQNLLNLGEWDSKENGGIDSPSTPRQIYASLEVSREDLIEAKKDRLFFGLLNKKVIASNNCVLKYRIINLSMDIIIHIKKSKNIEPKQY